MFRKFFVSAMVVLTLLNVVLGAVLYVSMENSRQLYEQAQSLEARIADMEQRAANTKQWSLASAYCYVNGRSVGLLSDYGDPNRVYAPPSMAESFAKATPDNPVRCVIVTYEKGTLTYGDNRIRLEPDHIYFPYFDGTQQPYLWWRADV